MQNYAQNVQGCVSVRDAGMSPQRQTPVMNHPSRVTCADSQPIPYMRVSIARQRDSTATCWARFCALRNLLVRRARKLHPPELLFARVMCREDYSCRSRVSWAAAGDVCASGPHFHLPHTVRASS